MNQRTDSPKPSLLDHLHSPSEVRDYSLAQLEELAQACRQRMIEVTSQRGGHLASSLGAVDLTVALAKVFNLTQDKVVWDVGHQAYAYKLLTGRHQRFAELGLKQGIGKFLKRSESPYDHFGAGHASTSISAGLGIAVGSRLNQERFKTLVVIGDGALTGGMAYEAMNHAGHLEEDLIVILNDNEMSIDPVVGALSKAIINISASKSFNSFRDEISKLSNDSLLPKTLKYGLKRLNESFMAFFTPGVWFENLNFRYFGQMDGHNIKDMVSLFQQIKEIKGPILLHLSTQKGRGYSFAEADSLGYHGVSAFDPETGTMQPSSGKGKSYTSIWSEAFDQVLAQDPKAVGISAAMLANTGLSELAPKYPDRIFDVGIAEEHAVTFAAGLATQGIKPFVVVYSTFLQRAIDQICHDVALQNLPVRFILDRAGFVGHDGATHHGVLDLTYLRMIPHLVIMAPKNGPELRAMVAFAANYDQGPIALRFPRANCELDQGLPSEPIQLGQGELLATGKDVLILAVGSMVAKAQTLIQDLGPGVQAGLINLRFIKPLDQALLQQQIPLAAKLVVMEENNLTGGLGSAVMEWMALQGLVKPILPLAIPDAFFEHATREEQFQEAGLDRASILKRVLTFLQG